MKYLIESTTEHRHNELNTIKQKYVTELISIRNQAHNDIIHIIDIMNEKHALGNEPTQADYKALNKFEKLIQKIDTELDRIIIF